MLRKLLVLSCLVYIHGRICPPSCEPPKAALGCQAYAKSAACSEDVRDISLSEADCGCLWQTYIQTIEPQAKIIFTEDGNQCYTWSAKVCKYLEDIERAALNQGISPQRKSVQRKFPADYTLENLLRRIQRLESIRTSIGAVSSEIPKHRRRNGVKMIPEELERVLVKEKGDMLKSQKSTVSKQTDIKENIIGKPEKSRSGEWIEMVPETVTAAAVGTLRNTISDKNIYHVRQHWIDIDMPVDKFKLSVFMLILLLNILFVVVLIFCRDSGSSGVKTNTKPAGDLDESVFTPDSPTGKSGTGNKKKTNTFRIFLEKFKRKTDKSKNKELESSPFLQMDPTNVQDFISDRNDFSNVRTSSPYIDAGMYRSPKKVSRGLYENIEEEDDFLDHTYESPLPPTTDFPEATDYYKRKYSLRSDSGTEEGSSPTKYFPRDFDPSNKSVSFTLPPGTYITLQDRVDGCTKKEEKASERTNDAVSNGLQ